MDGLCNEMKINRIVWERSKKGSDENDNSATNSQDLRERNDASLKFQDDVQKGNLSDPLKLSVSSSTYSSHGPQMLPLLPVPKLLDNSSSVSIILGGIACRATGPPVGAVDIGVSKSAYYFRIALPGVKKDPGEFSCEIEHDGKVHVRGVTTTGGQNVCRYSRVYEMKFQQQCPPGPFTLTFCLPGPVDPRLFSPNFRSDGIFEAVVMKYQL